MNKLTLLKGVALGVALGLAISYIFGNTSMFVVLGGVIGLAVTVGMQKA